MLPCPGYVTLLLRVKNFFIYIIILVSNFRSKNTPQNDLNHLPRGFGFQPLPGSIGKMSSNRPEVTFWPVQERRGSSWAKWFAGLEIRDGLVVSEMISETEVPVSSTSQGWKHCHGLTTTNQQSIFNLTNTHVALSRH